MSSLIKKAQLNARLLKNYGVIYSTVRNHWNKDFKPAPIPLTEEQRRLSAEKYGLNPKEYDVYPDDGAGYGDYPKIPAISAEAKDPHYPYDFPEHKRNFNEVLHVNADMFGEDRYNINLRPRYPIWVQLSQFLGVMSLSIFLFYMFDHVKCFAGVIPKQYPGQGKVHYTFESKE